MNFLTVLALAYVLGSIPFGWILAKAARLGDLRAIGSGNIGATNVLRTGRKGLAFLTLLLDASKGAAAVLLAEYFYPGMGQLAGLAAVFGHMFPVWLRFRGGKGVSTALGMLLALAWPVGFGALAIWILVAYFFRYSSLSALTASALSPALAFLFGYRDMVWLAAVLTVLIFIRHKKNVWRLVNHTEPKIGQNEDHEKKPA
jgi:acyl phosphate:glycerol-3-phosphate acyltransferase